MIQATVVVGWTSSRPVIPDEHFSTVVLTAPSEHEAELLATQLVASRPCCEMPTSSVITAVVL